MRTDLSIRQPEGRSSTRGLCSRGHGPPLVFRRQLSCLLVLSVKPTQGRAMTATTTSVHTQETTARKPLPYDYQRFRRRHCESEWVQTEKLYSHIDSIEGTHRADSFRKCRTFAWFARHNETGKVRVISNSCRQRWCPICSRARSYYLASQVRQWLESRPSPKFLTLTMKHTSAPLEHQVKWLYDHFRKFRQRKNIGSVIRGGVWFFQLKMSSRTGDWHPHLHCVIDSPYIPHDTLSTEWYAQTLTSNIVDIRTVKDPDKVSEYVARYCTRPAQLKDYQFEDTLEIFSVFHGKRMCGTWGTGKECSLRQGKPADSTSWEKVGSWRAVLTQARSLPRARAILNAWTNDKTLPEHIYVEDRTLGGEYDLTKFPSVGLEDLAGNWEEFP